MKIFMGLLALFVTFTVEATVRSWTNVLGGDWFASVNWQPNGIPVNGDEAMVTNNGTYTVIAGNSVTCTVITVGGMSGTQTLIYGLASTQLLITNSTVRANGVLAITNGGLAGQLLVSPGGQLQFNSSGALLYQFSLTNQGTVIWSTGGLNLGGSSTVTTYITNSGLWQITTNCSMSYGGGGRSVFYNAGTIQKTGFNGTTFMSGFDLVNLPSGIVDVTVGTIQLAPYYTNVLTGTFNATSPGILNFVGPCTDGGAILTGSGAIKFTSSILLLRTNLVAGLNLTGGDVYIAGTTTFQNAGAITNLTLNGSNLRGTNRLTGTLTFNAGNLDGKLTIETNGVMNLLSPSGTQMYSLNLLNQGNVMWSTGSINVGLTPPTVISNGGTWTIAGDFSMNLGGGTTACFTNNGLVRKTAGNSLFSSASLGNGYPVIFANEASGVVQVDVGTLAMPNNFTNAAGTLRLNGGNLTATTVAMTGGILEGSGKVIADLVGIGGTISPGTTNGSGRIIVQGNLDLRTNSTLAIDGTAFVPGTGYDQLTVSNGTASISNCTLQVTALPTVPVGTGFTVIDKTSAGTLLGAFNGLAENATVPVGAQLFQVHYGGGNSNDVTLVRISGTGADGPFFSTSALTNGSLKLQGAGGISTVYTIQATTNFLQWTNLGLVTGDIGGNFNFSDTNAAKFRYRFYRATN